MRYIVTHGGRAHLDDVMACALAMSRKGVAQAYDPPVARWEGPLPIHRREPTAEELEDPQVLCLDVGGRYEPAKGNFDHHQFERSDCRSAMLLVASHIRVPVDERGGLPLYAEILPKLFRWWSASVTIDQQGPFKAAESAGLEWAQVAPFIGPLAEVYLRQFANAASPEARGRFIYDTLTQYVERRMLAWADAKDRLVCREVDGLAALDFTGVQRPEIIDETVTQAVAAERGVDRGVLVFIASPRRAGEDWSNTGLTLMRIGEDPAIDFRRCRDESSVRFVHASGFLAQMRGRSVPEALRLIRTAVQPKPKLPAWWRRLKRWFCFWRKRG